MCVTITAVPIYIFLGFILGRWLRDMGLKKFGITVLYFSAISGVTLYILSRAITLVLAFTSLRGLPPGAYETVHWTTFINTPCINYIYISVNYLCLVHPDPLSQIPSTIPRRLPNEAPNLQGASCRLG